MSTPSPPPTASESSQATSFLTAPTTPGKQSRDNSLLLSDLHRILGAKLRVTMTDGRIACGTFVGLDRLCNIILENVVEYREIAYVNPINNAAAAADDDDDDDDGGVSSGRGDDDGGNNSAKCSKEEGGTDQIGNRECNNNNNNPNVYRWNTERSLSQAVIRGDRLTKVEIAKDEWIKRIGRCTVQYQN